MWMLLWVVQKKFKKNSREVCERLDKKEVRTDWYLQYRGGNDGGLVLKYIPGHYLFCRVIK